jgi:hypothetical protein
MSIGTFFRLLIVSGAMIMLTVYAKALAAPASPPLQPALSVTA